MMHIYVVLLEKLNFLHNYRVKECLNASNEFDSWVVLGHFDMMHAYELKQEGNLFEVISQNNQKMVSTNSTRNYFHPLFLLSDRNDEEFWNMLKTDYIAIARIHFSSSINVNQSYQALSEKLKTHKTDQGCAYQIYRTIELSDMILVVKSNQISALLKFTLTLQQYSEVGKVYTYCGIRYDKVMQSPIRLSYDGKDEIPLLSMRFSVPNYTNDAKEMIDKAKKLLKEKSAYSVVGIDDIVINCKELEVKKLVKLYQKWFTESSRSSHNISVGNVFTEVTTRVGTNLEEIDNLDNNQRLNYHQLPAICNQLFQMTIPLKRKVNYTLGQSEFLHTLFELTTILVRMGQTPLLDEFVYLMLPAVESFLKNLNIYFSELSEDDIQRCNYFVESWENLIEYGIQFERQLVHHPEMRPVLYDMPAAMLEYTLAFLNRTADILQMRDDNSVPIHFLLTPRLCKRIKAQELFPATSNDRPGLVVVTIPFQMLYKPHEVQCALCHEVSHFVGEYQRKREERRKKYIQSASALMAREFFNSCNSAYIKVIQECLMEATNGLEKFSIKMMRIAISDWLDTLLKSEKDYFDFLRRILKVEEPHDPYKLNMHDFNQIRQNRISYENYLDDLGILYREVYADICMLFLLPIKESEYVESLLTDLNTKTEDVEKFPYEAFAIRIYVSLKSSNRNIPFKTILCQSKPLYDKIKELNDLIDAKDESYFQQIPIVSIYYLLTYMMECFRTLETLWKDDDIKDIKKMFENVTSERMSYEKFIEVIDSYRKKILEEVNL